MPFLCLLATGEEIQSPNVEIESATTGNGHESKDQHQKQPESLEHPEGEAHEPQASTSPSSSRKSERGQKSSTLLRHLRHAMKPKSKK